MLWQVETLYPIAYDSRDHLYPAGTARDNHASGNFNRKLFSLFSQKISVLDLGCAGGGFVESVLAAGHEAVGLEGSNYSLARKRAAWATIPDNLFTCDISKPFIVHNGDWQPYAFDVVTAWEVVEHIEEHRIGQLMANILAHLADGGLFIMTTDKNITPPDSDESKWLHRTMKPLEWWLDTVGRAGFQRIRQLEAYFGNSWVRRGGNHRLVWRKI